MKKYIAIFASGAGSNAENIMQHFKNSSVGEVSLVISNNPDAYVLERARLHRVPAVVVRKTEFENGELVLDLLRANKIDFIVLAGFLLHIPDYLLHAYPDAIVNIHPSLLPKYGGKGMYGDYVHKAVVEAGEKESGITIHYVNEHYDSGAIIRQERCPVSASDTYDVVADKVHTLEYAFYPKVIEELLMR